MRFKKATVIGFLGIIMTCGCLQAQLTLDVDNRKIIRKNKIKSITVRFESVSDAKKYDSLETFRATFAQDGRVLTRKKVGLFGIVLYTNKYEYTYNKKGLLVQLVKTNVESPQNKEDSSYTNIVGYKPRTTKWTYEYDGRGKLVKEYEFLDKEAPQPLLMTEHEYNKRGYKIKSIYKNLRRPKETSSENRIEYFTYDIKNNLVKKVTNMVTMDYENVTIHTYNKKGRRILSENIAGDMKSKPVSKTVYKYLKKQLIAESFYPPKAKEWTQQELYEYDKNGRRIKITYQSRSPKDNWSKTFTYTKRGLIKTESWLSSNGKKAFTFHTVYKYY